MVEAAQEAQELLSQRWRWSELLVALRRVVLAGAVLAVGAAPWFYATGDDGHAGPVILLGAPLLLLVCLWLVLSRRLSRSPGPVLAGGLFLWMALAAAFSCAPGWSRHTLASWGSGLAVMLALVLSRPTIQEIRQVTFWLVTSAAVLCGVSLVHAHVTGFGDEHRFQATYSNADCFGALLMMAMVLGLGLLPLAWQPQNLLVLADLAVLGVGLVATQSRAAMVGAVVASVVVVLRRLWRPRQSWLLTVTAGVGLVAVLGLGVRGLAHTSLGARFREALTQAGAQGWAVRGAVWEGWLHTMVRSPWVGFGPGTFAQAFQYDRPHGLFTGYINQAHIDCIQVAVENGWPGLLLFLALVGTALYLGWRCKAAPSVLGAVGALLAVCIYGTMNFALPVAADLVWFFALLGLIYAYVEAARPHAAVKPQSTVHRVCAGHVLTVVVPLVLMALAKYLVDAGSQSLFCARAMDQAEQQGQAQHWMAAITASNAAVSWEPLSDAARLQRADLMEQVGQKTGSYSLIAGAAQDMADAVRLNPDGKENRLRAAEFFFRWGDGRRAERLLLDACRANPRDSRVWTQLSWLAARRDQPRAAAEFLWLACWGDAAGGDEINPLSHLIGEIETLNPGRGCLLLLKWGRTYPDYRQMLATIALKACESTTTLIIQPATAEALTRVAALLSLDPSTWLSLAIVELQEGNVEGCLAAMQAAHAPPSVAATVVEEADLDKTQAAAGLHLLASSLQLEPGNDGLRMQMARLYALKQDAVEARRIYREALHRDPDNPQLYEALGNLEFAQGHARQAHLLYLDAARLNPGDDAYQVTLSKFEHSHPETGIRQP